MNFIGAEELRAIYIEPEDTELIIKYKSHISSIFISEINTAYVMTTPIKDYYSFIVKNDNIRENIFENNVRHFQGNVAVNKAIMETLKKENDLEFWWLNNGITMLASEIIPLPDNKLRIKNCQIVNGLQTTFCIYEYFKENSEKLINENRSVMIKLIQTTDIKSTDNIISSTNSQTAIRPADLRATDDLQRNIEEYFLAEGYFYDRRKDYYKNMNKDRNKIFAIAKTAQHIETLLYKSPHSARSNPTSLLKSDENYKKIFNKKFNIEVYLKSCLIYKKIDLLVKEIQQNEDIILKKYGASIKNFTFHLMLVTTVIAINNSKFNDIELANLNLDNINHKKFQESIDILLELIEELETEDKLDNIINTAKSKFFTDSLLVKLNTYYS